LYAGTRKNPSPKKKVFSFFRPHWAVLCVWLGTCTSVWGQLLCDYQAYQVPIPGFAANRSFKEVYQDHIGLLWIGTQDGLFVFDGNSAVRFNTMKAPIGTSEVFALAEDNKNRLWINTRQGLFVLEPTRENTIEPNRIGIPDSLLLNPNFNLCQGPGKSLFILSGDQIYHWQGDQLCRWANVLPEFINARGAKMFFSLKDQYLFIQPYLLSSVWVVSEQGKIKKTEPSPPCSINQLEEDLILKFVFNYGLGLDLLSYDRNLKDFKPYKQPEDIERQFLHPVQKVLQQDGYTGREVPSNWQIYPLQRDIWAVSCSEGLFLVYSTQRLFNSIADSRAQRIRGITTDQYNHLIYGTHNGLYWHDPIKGRSQVITDEAVTIWSIVAMNATKDRFIASGEGFPERFFLLKSTPQNVVVDNVRILTEMYMECMAILKDQDGRGFWYSQGTNGNLYLKLLRPNGYEHDIMQTAIPVNQIRSIAQTDGIWLGTDKGLLYADVSDSDSNTITLRTEKVPAALQHCYINVVQADKQGNLWIGTRNQGLFYYEPHTKKLTQYTTREGLADNTVFSITETNNHVIWIGTGNGLSRLDRPRNWFQNYNTNDGLLDNEFNTPAAHLAADGTLYIGGQNGINYFQADDFKTDTAAAPNYLAVRLGGGSADAAPHRIYLTPQSYLRVKPRVDLLEISFRSASLIHAQRTHFRYRISTLDTLWHYANYADKAVFTRLPTGNHTLEVQCQSHRGMWGAATTYFIEVLPPWYKTWWFRTLLTFSIFSALYGLHRLRIYSLRREFQLRKSITHDLHDSLGSRIYLLRNLSQQIADPLMNDTTKLQKLSKFEDISRDTLQTIRNFIWSFDPQQDGLGGMFDRMEDFADNYLTPLIASVEIQRSGTADGVKIGPRTKHHLMNVYQELITNMVKHTSCKKMVIQLMVQESKIIIQLINSHNGKTNAHNEDTKERYGMESLEARLKGIDADLHWMDDSRQQIAVIQARV